MKYLNNLMFGQYVRLTASGAVSHIAVILFCKKSRSDKIDFG